MHVDVDKAVDDVVDLTLRQRVPRAGRAITRKSDGFHDRAIQSPAVAVEVRGRDGAREIAHGDVVAQLVAGQREGPVARSAADDARYFVCSQEIGAECLA